MLNTIINTVIILTLLYTSYSLWKIGKRRKENSLLFKMISLFILIHIVIFPIIYVLIINNDPSSIKIDNKILSFEKEAKLKDLELSYNKKDIENQIFVIEDIIASSSGLLKEEDIIWADYDEIFDDEDHINFLTLEKYTLYFHYRFKETPSTPFGNFIDINPKNKNYKAFELNGGFDMSAIEILKKELNKFKSLKEENFNELNIIKSNKFWSYKEVLPYTINILFTDSFKPKRRVSQVVHFLHNMIVAVFILGFIVSLLQNNLTKEDKNQSIEERLDRIEELLKEKE
jgi:hypothetical protein